MKVVAQSVSTPRSKTTTGFPVSQARSTAGVSAAAGLLAAFIGAYVIGILTPADTEAA